MYKVKRVLLFGINTQLLDHPSCNNANAGIANPPQNALQFSCPSERRQCITPLREIREPEQTFKQALVQQHLNLPNLALGHQAGLHLIALSLLLVYPPHLQHSLQASPPNIKS